MGRAEQHGAERRELLERHLLRPVAVVDVKVDDRDTLAVGGDRVRRADPDVVEEAEAVAAGDLVPPVDHRVVPRRAHQAEGRVRRVFARVGEHAVDRRDDRARRAPRRAQRARRDVRHAVGLGAREGGVEERARADEERRERADGRRRPRLLHLGVDGLERREVGRRVDARRGRRRDRREVRRERRAAQPHQELAARRQPVGRLLVLAGVVVGAVLVLEDHELRRPLLVARALPRLLGRRRVVREVLVEAVGALHNCAGPSESEEKVEANSWETVGSM